MNNMKENLLTLFQRHRVVFWYDTKKELLNRFQQLEIEPIQKIEIQNNQVALKHLILRKAPDQKFLLYHQGPEPPPQDNWLLDLQLSGGRFRTHQLALRIAELDINPSLEPQLEPYAPFFNEKNRRDKLKTLLKPRDSIQTVRLKMLAVIAATESHTDALFESLLHELAQQKDKKIKQINDHNLSPILWEQAQRHYGYTSPTPGIEDFARSIFSFAWRKFTGGAGGTTAPKAAELLEDTLVFLKRWKENTRHRGAFETLARRLQEQLDIPAQLSRLDYALFGDFDIFPEVEGRVLEGLVADVSARGVSAGRCEEIIRRRRQSFWYPSYEHHYRAVGFAARYFELLKQAPFTIESISAGLRDYAGSLYEVDRFYRKYHDHLRNISSPGPLETLTRQLDHEYLHNFLLSINPAWERHADAEFSWQAPGANTHKNFFTSQVVGDFLQKDLKCCVIVSGALRYESGRELYHGLLREERLHAEIRHGLAVLPVNGPLGAAALLPHEEITLRRKGCSSGAPVVYVDGIAASGIKGHEKILRRGVSGGASVVNASILLKADKDERRGWLKKNRVLYIYHDLGLSSGSKGHKPEKLFRETEGAVKEVLSLVKKLAHDGAANVLVTCPHGFVYHGGGGDSVHRGITLQESVVPVIHVNRVTRKRGGGDSLVEVDILNGDSGVITGGRLDVRFFQVLPVDGERVGRELRVGVYTGGGRLVSESHRIHFDLKSPDSRDREVCKSFILTRGVGGVGDEEVVLRLEEFDGDTSSYRLYKSRSYVLKTAFE